MVSREYFDDFFILEIANRGVEDFFLLNLRRAMHSNNSVGLEKRVSYTWSHYERASVTAVEAGS